MKCSLWGVILQTTQVIFHHDTLQGPGLILDPFNFSWLSNKHVFGITGATQMAMIHASIQLTALCPAPGWVSAGGLGHVRWTNIRSLGEDRQEPAGLLPLSPHRLGGVCHGGLCSALTTPCSEGVAGRQVKRRCQLSWALTAEVQI